MKSSSLPGRNLQSALPRLPYGRTYSDRVSFSGIPKVEVLSIGGSQTDFSLVNNRQMRECYMIVLLHKMLVPDTLGQSVECKGQWLLYFVSPFIISTWNSSQPEGVGYCCLFSEAFFNEGIENKVWLKLLPFFAVGEEYVVALSEKQYAFYSRVMEDIYLEKEHEKKANNGIIRTLLHLLLYKAQNEFSTVIGEKILLSERNAAWGLTSSFLYLCQLDFEDLMKGDIPAIPTIREYAARLMVTKNYLNDTVKSITGKPARYHILQLYINQATMMLRNTVWTIHEISIHLGFEDPSYFSRFYRKHTGLTPSAVRSDANK